MMGARAGQTNVAVRTVILRPLFGCLLALLVQAGCMERVNLRVEDTWAESYVDSPPYDLNPGKYFVVLLSSDSNLEAVSKRKNVHHMSFRLIACSNPDTHRDLCSGEMHSASEPLIRERSVVLKPGTNWYSLYLPMDRRRLLECAKTIGSSENPEAIVQAGENGVCLKVRGSSFGFGFEADEIRLPLRVGVDGLEKE